MERAREKRLCATLEIRDKIQILVTFESNANAFEKSNDQEQTDQPSSPSQWNRSFTAARDARSGSPCKRGAARSPDYGASTDYSQYASSEDLGSEKDRGKTGMAHARGSPPPPLYFPGDGDPPSPPNGRTIVMTVWVSFREVWNSLALCSDGETGRHEGLKIPLPQGSAGSSPAPSIKGYSRHAKRCAK
jgi:hypothetical protein